MADPKMTNEKKLEEKLKDLEKISLLEVDDIAGEDDAEISEKTKKRKLLEDLRNISVLYQEIERLILLTDADLKKPVDENNNAEISLERRKLNLDRAKDKYDQLKRNHNEIIIEKIGKFREIEASGLDLLELMQAIIEMPNLRKTFGNFMDNQQIADALYVHQQFLHTKFGEILKKYSELKADKTSNPEEIKNFEKTIYGLGTSYLSQTIQQQAAAAKITQMKEAEKSWWKRTKNKLPYFGKRGEAAEIMSVLRQANYHQILGQPAVFNEAQFHIRMKAVFSGKGVKIDKGESGEQQGVKLTRSRDGTNGTLEILDKDFTGIIKITRNIKGDLINSYDYIAIENGEIVFDKCIFSSTKGTSSFSKIKDANGMEYNVDQNAIKLHEKKTRKIETIDEKKFQNDILQKIYAKEDVKKHDDLADYFQHNFIAKFFTKQGWMKDIKLDSNGYLKTDTILKNIKPEYKKAVEQAIVETCKMDKYKQFSKYCNDDALCEAPNIDYTKNPSEMMIQQMLEEMHENIIKIETRKAEQERADREKQEAEMKRAKEKADAEHAQKKVPAKKKVFKMKPFPVSSKYKNGISKINFKKTRGSQNSII